MFFLSSCLLFISPTFDVSEGLWLMIMAFSEYFYLSFCDCSKTAMTRTTMARLPWMIRIVFESQISLSIAPENNFFREIFLIYHVFVCCVYS